jgi:RNA polymerase sigma factor (TIGR02999 family)
LRQMARARMAREKPGQTLQATALVHDAWLKISNGGKQPFADRRHFLRVAAQAMQQILIDHARRKQTPKHGGDQLAEELHESRIASWAPADELLAVSDALAELTVEDPQAAEVVRLRYFVGITLAEIAETLQLSPRAVDRYWAFARAWLKLRIKDELRISGNRCS